MSTQSASPPAAKTTATSSIDNFMGKSSGKKKGQTLAQMQQANDGFLTGEKKKPVASSPSIFMQGIMNYYDVLGVAVMSSDEEIKAKYKQKSLDLHPDRHQNQAEDDVAMYKLVTKAYETLSDPVAKMQYDMEQRMNNQGAAQPSMHFFLFIFLVSDLSSQDTSIQNNPSVWTDKHSHLIFEYNSIKRERGSSIWLFFWFNSYPAAQQNWLNHLGGGGGRPAGNAQQPMGGFGFGSSPPPMQQQQQQQQQRSNDPFGFF